MLAASRYRILDSCYYVSDCCFIVLSTVEEVWGIYFLLFFISLGILNGIEAGVLFFYKSNIDFKNGGGLTTNCVTF